MVSLLATRPFFFSHDLDDDSKDLKHQGHTITPFVSDGNQKLSAMIGTLFSLFGSCKCHLNLKERDVHRLKLIPKEDALCRCHFYKVEN